jgi:ATP-dependent exoDNAse (exonuclease V) alpha subunit
MDGGRTVEIDPQRQLHLDHGYAVTSYSSQGQTADRVLIHVDTESAATDLLNSRMAHVAVSGGAHDAQIFTNNASALAPVHELDKPAVQLSGEARLRTCPDLCFHWSLRTRIGVPSTNPMDAI